MTRSSAAGQPVGNPIPPEQLAGLFDRIAPIYDAMNTVMTAGLDARWRRAAVAAAGLAPGMRVLDVACGTGILTRAAGTAVGASGEVLGIDLSQRMLAQAVRLGRRRGSGPVRYLRADAMALPLADASFDAVTIGFGLRNLPDYAGGLAEMSRVLAPGGRLVVLEIAAPSGGLALLLYRGWFQRIVPLLGRVLRRGPAYRYLPDSLRRYPAPERIAHLLRQAGLEQVSWRRLPSGMATLHVGIRQAT